MSVLYSTFWPFVRPNTEAFGLWAEQYSLSLSPITFSLKAHDVQALQALSSRVSVIPIIAKGDTLTKREKKLFKEKVSCILKVVFVVM
jgi:hypothetical protein